MNRPYRPFRGMKLDGKAWIFGDIHWGKGYKSAHIHPIPGRHLSFKVHPATVGQSTGLKDKNGTEIYEGDGILREWDHTRHGHRYKGKEQGFVKWDDDYGQWFFISEMHDPYPLEEAIACNESLKMYAVISGTIHNESEVSSD